MKKQRFKNQELTERKCINNIMRFYRQAQPTEIRDGLTWYNLANEYCTGLSKRFGISLSQAAGLIAVFSPQASWSDNKRYVVTFLLNQKKQIRSMVQQDKALKILSLQSEDLIYNSLSVSDKALKTKSFFLNILNPDISLTVTIDRHAIAVCLQRPNRTWASNIQNFTNNQYSFFQKAYIEAAKQIGILPHQLQAITWLVYRRLRELKEHDTKMEWQPFTTETF